MQIDWLIVGAQVVNFLLLVFLLQRFLYRPVLEAMARREKRIADRLHEADAREQSAQRKAMQYEQQLAQIDAQRTELLAAAKTAVADERRDLLARAHAEITQAETHWRQDLEREQRELLGDLRHELAAAAQLVARKALADLADAELQQQMISTLLGRLDRLDSQARAALAASGDGLTVRAAFMLDSTQRGQITRALHERLGREVAIHYAQDDALVCGIALEGGGRQLAWNLADYLDGFEQRLRERLSTLENSAAGSET